MNAALLQKATKVICSHIGEWEVLQESNVILTYMPMGNEVNVRPLLDKYPGKKWVIPRILPGNQMAFHFYDPEKLVMHEYGMLEPSPDCPIVSHEEIDLALVPGLAFDPNGGRLGFGGGFYDRFLCDFKGVTLGVTYNALFINHVPCGEYDIPMRFVVTQKGIHNPLIYTNPR
ncbi:MAG: putative protein YqgN [Chloroflexi bacterium]|nr:putative protein YqgN [Chloroflexota bacterium]